MDISIRPIIEADLDTANTIFQSAFDRPESRKVGLQRYFALPTTWFLASLYGEPAGMGSVIDYGSFAYLGMMAVHKNAQRKGIGRALMQHLLNWTDERGISMILLDATEAGASLYVQFGFVECDLACVFEGRNFIQSSDLPDHVHLLGLQDIQTLVDFDTPIFGANREAVFRMLLADFPNRAFVVNDEFGQMSGYLFAQSRQIGPWVARRPQDAERLLQAALSLSYDGTPKVIVPKMNPTAAELFERFGFTFVHTNSHMRRGGLCLPGQRSVIYGQTSFAVG